LGYGVLRQERDAAFRKTDDRIDFVSKYGRQVVKSFFVAALFGFRSQMKPGYDSVDPVSRQMISRFFSPAYFQLAVGLDFKPDSYLSVFMAPLSSKLTVVGDPALSAAGAFGVTPGSVAKAEMGGYVRLIFSRSDFKSDALKNVSLTSKLDLFSNYLDHPEDVDVNWENQLGLTVNKYLSINIHTHLVYDADVLFPSDDGLCDVPKLQFKEIFAIGFSLRF
jgi:hypothetical protein